jgi:16S rRNA (guanine527-N7)-methyltransferase
VARRVVRTAKEAYRLDRRREPLPTRVEDTPTLPAVYDDVLRSGLDALALELTAGARSAIDGHVRLLLAWTTAINLTAIRAPAAVALGHVVDSLSALPLISERRPRRLLDVGSGGGFPGIPLAACLTDATTDVTLLEPTGKKAGFLRTVVDATGLGGHVRVDGRRAEEVARGVPHHDAWDLVTARAVGSTADLVELTFPLLVPGGALVTWKRGDLADELAAARRAIAALGGGDLVVWPVHVPGLAGHRLVVASRGRGDVPARYPRDPAQRKRRPW